MRRLRRFFIGFFLLVLSLPQGARAQTGPARQMTLTEALEQTLRQHPLLVAAREPIAAAEGNLFSSGRKPNPTIGFSMENLPVWRTRDGFSFSRDMDMLATYAQRFERGGKRENRVRLAATGVDLARVELEIVERQILSRVRFAWEAVVAAGARSALARQSLDNFQQIVRYNEVRVSEGYTAEGDLIKTRLEAERLSYTQRRFALDYDRAKIKLLEAMGSSTFDINFDLDEEIQFEPVALETVDLTAAALSRPEIRAAHERLRQAEATLVLERSRSTRDVTTTLGYKRNGPDNALFGALLIPLNVYDRNRGAISRSEAMVREARARVIVERNGVLAELAAARQGILAAENQVRSLQAQFLAIADESNSIALAAYREGAQDLLFLLEAERSRNSAQELFLSSVSDYRLAVRELEMAAGVDSLPRLGDRSTDQSPALDPLVRDERLRQEIRRLGSIRVNEMLRRVGSKNRGSRK